MNYGTRKWIGILHPILGKSSRCKSTYKINLFVDTCRTKWLEEQVVVYYQFHNMLQS